MLSIVKQFVFMKLCLDNLEAVQCAASCTGNLELTHKIVIINFFLIFELYFLNVHESSVDILGYYYLGTYKCMHK